MPHSMTTVPDSAVYQLYTQMPDITEQSEPVNIQTEKYCKDFTHQLIKNKCK